MAGYVPEGKPVREWVTEPTGPKVPDIKPQQKYSDGSGTDYNRPWPGDVEARPGTLSRVATSLQQNIGNYLLYRATMGVEEISEAVKGEGGEETPTPPALGPAPKPRPHGGPTPSGPAGEVGPGPRGLGPGPTPTPDTPATGGGTGSAAPLGPSRRGVAPDRGIDAARAEMLDDFTNKDQTSPALFPRDAFSGPIALGPRSEDRRPKGRDIRGKSRFQQMSFDF